MRARAMIRSLAIVWWCGAASADEPYSFADKAELETARDVWFLSPDAAELLYGHISGWDVSSVEDMSYLFGKEDYGDDDEEDEGPYRHFDDDIGGWDVSAVQTMRGMFKQGHRRLGHVAGDDDEFDV